MQNSCAPADCGWWSLKDCYTHVQSRISLEEYKGVVKALLFIRSQVLWQAKLSQTEGLSPFVLTCLSTQVASSFLSSSSISASEHYKTIQVKKTGGIQLNSFNIFLHGMGGGNKQHASEIFIQCYIHVLQMAVQIEK